MTLTDSGPLAALYLPDDRHHHRTVSALAGLSPPMVTTMPCFTEALYFIGKERGWNGQARLWQLVLDGRLDVRAFTAEDLIRMHELMGRFMDTPMDVADASLVTLAENLNETLIFTIDSHFRAYRLPDRRSFRITPEIEQQ